MIKHIIKHWILYLFAIFVITFSFVLPDVSLEIQGGIAWFTVFLGLFIGGCLSWAGLFGGEIVYSSEGLIPIIKRYKNKNKKESE